MPFQTLTLALTISWRTALIFIVLRTELRKVHNTGSISLFKMSFFFKCLLIKINSIRRLQCFLIVTISISTLDFRWTPIF